MEQMIVASQLTLKALNPTCCTCEDKRNGEQLIRNLHGARVNTEDALGAAGRWTTLDFQYRLSY